MNYFKHLYLNAAVGVKCITLGIIHILHGIIPIRFTEHEWLYAKIRYITYNIIKEDHCSPQTRKQPMKPRTKIIVLTFLMVSTYILFHVLIGF
jgi:hypothetical protein